MTASLSESTFSTAPQQGQVRSKLCGFFGTTPNDIPKLVDLGHPSFSFVPLVVKKRRATTNDTKLREGNRRLRHL